MIQVYVTVAVQMADPAAASLPGAAPEILVRMSTNQFDWEFDPAIADLGMICTKKPDRPNLALHPSLRRPALPRLQPGIAQGGTGCASPPNW